MARESNWGLLTVSQACYLYAFVPLGTIRLVSRYYPYHYATLRCRLVELTRLKRQGYALRMTYEAFLVRYRLLSVHTWPRWREGCAQEGTMCLLRDLLVSPSDFAYGRTKVFIRSPRTVRVRFLAMHRARFFGSFHLSTSKTLYPSNVFGS